MVFLGNRRNYGLKLTQNANVVSNCSVPYTHYYNVVVFAYKNLLELLFGVLYLFGD